MCIKGEGKMNKDFECYIFFFLIVRFVRLDLFNGSIQPMSFCEGKLLVRVNFYILVIFDD